MQIAFETERPSDRSLAQHNTSHVLHVYMGDTYSLSDVSR
jgi:hypothetical protein